VNTKNITIPPKSDGLAEFIGILLGDGNIWVQKNGINTNYQLKIAGDLTEDKDYLLNYVKPLCYSLFSIEPKLQELPKVNELFVVLYSKNVISFLDFMGLKPGHKIKNQITIPNWIYERESYLKACLRGLIDTDGSIFKMSNQDPKLLRISFKNFNTTLLEDTREIFLKLDFHPSKLICNDCFFLSRQSEVKRYIQEIGFSNKKHINRINKFQ